MERAWRTGVKASPDFVYHCVRDFSALRAALEHVIEHNASALYDKLKAK